MGSGDVDLVMDRLSRGRARRASIRPSSDAAVAATRSAVRRHRRGHRPDGERRHDSLLRRVSRSGHCPLDVAESRTGFLSLDRSEPEVRPVNRWMHELPTEIKRIETLGLGPLESHRRIAAGIGNRRQPTGRIPLAHLAGAGRLGRHDLANRNQRGMDRTSLSAGHAGRISSGASFAGTARLGERRPRGAGLQRQSA